MIENDQNQSIYIQEDASKINAFLKYKKVNELKNKMYQTLHGYTHGKTAAVAETVTEKVV